MMSAGNWPSHIKIVRKAWQSEGSATPGTGAPDAKCLPGWPEKGRPGARSFGKETLAQVFSHAYAGLKPARAYGYETCRLGGGFLPSTSSGFFFFPLEETPRLNESFLFVTELLLDI